MARIRVSTARKGATILEFAVIAPATFLVLLGLIVGGLGVFRYQEVAHLAREATRYASTHGGQYIRDGLPASTGVSAISSDSDIQAYLASKTVGLDPAKLTVTITWSSPNTINPRNMPSYVDTDTSLVPPGQKVVQNYVTVTVTYDWMPEVFVVGPVRLTSSSTVAMSY